MPNDALVRCETQSKQVQTVLAHTIIQRLSVYGVLVQGDTVLCVKTHSDNWEVPGGTPEPGENLEAALRRELQEEATIDVSIGKLFYIRESFYLTPSQKAYHSLQLYFMVQSQDQPRPGAGTAQAVCVPLSEISEHNTNRSTYLALQHLHEDTVAYDLWNPAQQAA